MLNSGTSFQRQLKYLDLVIGNNKVPHAFLFYGKCGGRKLETAKYCIFRINSPKSERPDFKPANPLAESIIKETHPDVFIVRRPDDKKEIPIAQVRALRNFVSKTPMNLGSKSAIIDGAEFLGEESWNALLKTIEEPSGNTIIFILSSGIGGIPKTIVSRTIALPFYGEDNSAVRSGPENGIILRKLANIERLSILEKFDLAEKISAADYVSILDDWLLDLRSGVLKKANRTDAETVENIINAKSVLVSTNANPRLVLENLFLNI